MEFKIKNTNSIAGQDGVKILIHASSGTGKTTQLGTLEGKTLILSAESGLLVLRDKDIDVVDIGSMSDFGEVYVAIRDKKLEYDNVCIDSMSEIAEMLVDELEADEYYGSSSNTFVKWGEYTRRMTKIIKSFRDLKGINVIFTALTESVESNGTVKYTPQVPAKKFQSKLVSMFDFVVYMTVDQDGRRLFHHDESSMWVAKSRIDLESTAEVTDEYNIGEIIKKISSN